MAPRKRPAAAKPASASEPAATANDAGAPSSGGSLTIVGSALGPLACTLGLLAAAPLLLGEAGGALVGKALARAAKTSSVASLVQVRLLLLLLLLLRCYCRCAAASAATAPPATHCLTHLLSSSYRSSGSCGCGR